MDAYVFKCANVAERKARGVLKINKEGKGYMQMLKRDESKGVCVQVL